MCGKEHKFPALGNALNIIGDCPVMNIFTAIAALLLVFCLSTSFQCQQCGTKTLRLDNTKSWLPLKGRTQLSFSDNTGNTRDFRIRVVDTIETALNDCSQPFQYEYLHATLYLNQSSTDSIHFSLSSGGWLCMLAISNNEPNIAMCNVFGQTKAAQVAKRLANFQVGSTIYPEAILLLSSPALTNNIDSVVIANNKGIVGFRYANNNYTLQ